jgi:hypothetical protein
MDFSCAFLYERLDTPNELPPVPLSLRASQGPVLWRTRGALRRNPAAVRC